MQFNATSINVTEVLVAALAVAAAIFLLRKRYDSNLPLLFYFAAIVFTNMSDRAVNPYLMYSGLALALVVRFEFMGASFAKFVGYLAAGCLCLIVYSMVSDVLA